MNLIGRDVRFDFQDAVNVHSGHAKTGRDSGKEERTERRNHDLKPRCLIGRSRSGSGGHKGFPRSLETSSEVSGKRKRTAGILQTGDITLLSHRLFIPCFLRFPVRSDYIMQYAIDISVCNLLAPYTYHIYAVDTQYHLDQNTYSYTFFLFLFFL